MIPITDNAPDNEHEWYTVGGKPFYLAPYNDEPNARHYESGMIIDSRGKAMRAASGNEFTTEKAIQANEIKYQMVQDAVQDGMMASIERGENLAIPRTEREREAIKEIAKAQTDIARNVSGKSAAYSTKAAQFLFKAAGYMQDQTPKDGASITLSGSAVQNIVAMVLEQRQNDDKPGQDVTVIDV